MCVHARVVYTCICVSVHVRVCARVYLRVCVLVYVHVRMRSAIVTGFGATSRAHPGMQI